MVLLYFFHAKSAVTMLANFVRLFLASDKHARKSSYFVLFFEKREALSCL